MAASSTIRPRSPPPRSPTRDLALERRRARHAIRVLSCLAAAINVVFTPFVVSFLGVQCLARSAWAAVLAACDVLLWLEVLVALSSECHAAKQLRGTRMRRLFERISRWLLHVGRVACLMPWDWLVGDDDAADGRTLCISWGHLTRCFFVGHLFAQLGAAMNHFFPALGTQRASMQFVVLISNSIAVVHWYGCLLYAAPRLESEAERPRTWVELSEINGRPYWARYVRSLDRALLIVLGEGEHGETDLEVLISMFGLLFGTGFVALFTSKMVEIITSTNYFEQMARRKIGRVQSFMAQADLPADLQQRCTAHLQHFMFATSLTADTVELLRELSSPLRDEVNLASRRSLVVDMLDRSKWFDGSREGTSDIPDLFVKMLVSRLTPAVFSPGDMVIVGGELGSEAYLIQSGFLHIPLPDGTLLTRGAGECVGEIAMITKGPRSTSVIAATHVEAYSLSQADFLECSQVRGDGAPTAAQAQH